MAQSSGTSPNQANTERQGGIGPASGNGNSSKPADKAAAAHNFQAPDFQIEGSIQGRVYRIGRFKRCVGRAASPPHPVLDSPTRLLFVATSELSCPVIHSHIPWANRGAVVQFDQTANPKKCKKVRILPSYRVGSWPLLVS
jgi:hypothetical protein